MTSPYRTDLTRVDELEQENERLRRIIAKRKSFIRYFVRYFGLLFRVMKHFAYHTALHENAPPKVLIANNEKAVISNGTNIEKKKIEITFDGQQNKFYAIVHDVPKRYMISDDGKVWLDEWHMVYAGEHYSDLRREAELLTKVYNDVVRLDPSVQKKLFGKQKNRDRHDTIATQVQAQHTIHATKKYD